MIHLVIMEILDALRRPICISRSGKRRTGLMSSKFAVDPFGWWGSEPDPIESIRGNRSEWLWKSSWLVDDNDNGFQRYYGPAWDRMAVGYDGDCWIAPPTKHWR